MAPREILPREALEEHTFGALTQLNHQVVVSHEPLGIGEPLYHGQITFRYGVRFLGKTHYSIIPELIVLDYGTMMNGVEAWEFLLNKSNMYPRAEIFGHRHDGVDDIITIRQLDLALPIVVFAFTHPVQDQPFAQLSAWIAPSNSSSHISLPPYLIKYIPVFETIAQWQKTLE